MESDQTTDRDGLWVGKKLVEESRHERKSEMNAQEQGAKATETGDYLYVAWWRNFPTVRSKRESCTETDVAMRRRRHIQPVRVDSTHQDV